MLLVATDVVGAELHVENFARMLDERRRRGDVEERRGVLVRERRCRKGPEAHREFHQPRPRAEAGRGRVHEEEPKVRDCAEADLPRGAASLGLHAAIRRLTRGERYEHRVEWTL